jgi:serine/threonine-protein kinase
VAVKVIRADLVGTPGAVERFRREARVAAGFAHPHVVTVHDFGVVAGVRAYLVMELLEGTTLRALLAQVGRLEPPRALAILDDVALAVDAAHRRQIIHRDLKPENVMLVKADRGESAKVLDFGVAKLLSVDEGSATVQPTAFGGLVGTPLYMAPEQLRGEEAAPAWDIWALAVIAFEMLDGRHPFAGDPGGIVRSAAAGGEAPISDDRLPGPWRGWFAGALSPDPSRRPATARELVAGRRAVIRGGPQHA